MKTNEIVVHSFYASTVTYFKRIWAWFWKRTSYHYQR